MKECISREAALAALKEYNKEPFHILHGLTVEGVMRWYANELGCGEDADFWARWACSTTSTLRCGRSSTASRRLSC